MFANAHVKGRGGYGNMQTLISNNNTKVYMNQSASSSSDEVNQDSDQSANEDPDTSSQSSCSTANNPHSREKVSQLRGLFQIPKKHLLPDMVRYPTPPVSKLARLSSASSYTSSDEQQCTEGVEDELLTNSLDYPRHDPSRSQYSSSSREGSTTSTSDHNSPRSKRFASPHDVHIHAFPNGQQLKASVLTIRGIWAALEANRGPEKWLSNLRLISDLSRYISIDGCTLFECHISHLLPGGNHVFKMEKLWLSLSAGQKTYWRKHSSKFQTPLAFEFWQLALRNLETEDHEERYSSIVRKAKRILEDASLDSEGHLIASPNWRHPIPERELQIWRLDEFAATRKIQRRLHDIQVSFGVRKKTLCRSLASFVAGSGWTMFAYHGIPRLEEVEEMDVMVKLRAVWSGMTADDRLYWMDLTGRLLEGLKCGSVESLARFSFDAWAVKEARMSAEAWGRLLV